MPESYTSQGSRRDVQVTSPTTVLDVEIVSATTVPDGVYFEFPVPLLSWQQIGEEAFVEPVAEGINAVLGNPNVAGGYWSQDIDENGLIADTMNFTVFIPTPQGRTGPFTTQIQVPVALLGADPALRNAAVEPLIDAAVHALERTASG